MVCQSVTLTAIAAAIRSWTVPRRSACPVRFRLWCLLTKWQCQMPSRAVRLRRPDPRTSRRLTAAAYHTLKTVCTSHRRTGRHFRRQGGHHRGRPACRRRQCQPRHYLSRTHATPAVIIRMCPGLPPLEIRWTWYFRSIMIRHHRRSTPGHPNRRRSRCRRIWGFLSR